MAAMRSRATYRLTSTTTPNSSTCRLNTTGGRACHRHRADFISDFNHLFPRPPLSSLSAVPTAFLNLWAHFMHKRKHSIVGHSVLMPATSASRLRHITAWDVYRSVVEHGGYHHVAQHALWHPCYAAHRAVVEQSVTAQASDDYGGGSRVRGRLMG